MNGMSYILTLIWLLIKTKREKQEFDFVFSTIAQLYKLQITIVQIPTMTNVRY